MLRAAASRIGVGEHDQVVLGPAQREHALAIGGRARACRLGHRGGTHERGGGYARMVEQRVHGGGIALRHREHPRGQARLGEQLRQAHGRARDLLAGLEHEGVAAGDGDREHPQRHHGGKIERRDAGHHPQGVAPCAAVDPVRDLEQLPGGQLRQRAGVLDHLQPLADAGLGLGHRLAVLARHQKAERADVGLDQLLEPEQRLHGSLIGVRPQATAASAAAATVRETAARVAGGEAAEGGAVDRRGQGNGAAAALHGASGYHAQGLWGEGDLRICTHGHVLSWLSHQCKRICLDVF